MHCWLSFECQSSLVIEKRSGVKQWLDAIVVTSVAIVKH